MISELIKNDFGIKEKKDFSCSEKKLCGAISASAMVLAKLFVKDRAHEGEYCKGLINEFVSRFESDMNSTTCKNLKDDFRTEEVGCKSIVLRAAEILDEIVLREKK